VAKGRQGPSAGAQRTTGNQDSFLREACAGDPELQREVESLLRHYQEAGGFSRSPAAGLLKEADVEGLDETALASGTRLGPYEVESLVGAGGMGEVYRARDTRLHRTVAVKVLPASFAVDAGRQRRFVQEARAVAALSHPNILVIHDIGSQNGLAYLVSELLEGNTLREELRKGALPLPKTVEYSLQIAQGLGAAHAKGVIHRDLKPENVFVTAEGHVKILDFGLAKLTAHTVSADATTTATQPAQFSGLRRTCRPSRSAAGLPMRSRISSAWVR
jgi:serine/threonine protein kinase